MFIVRSSGSSEEGTLTWDEEHHLLKGLLGPHLLVLSRPGLAGLTENRIYGEEAVGLDSKEVVVLERDSLGAGEEAVGIDCDSLGDRGGWVRQWFTQCRLQNHRCGGASLSRGARSLSGRVDFLSFEKKCRTGEDSLRSSFKALLGCCSSLVLNV